MFRKLRIAVLLIVLVFVALNTLLDRYYSRTWRGPLLVALYPVNADSSAASDAFMRALSIRDTQALEDFFSAQAIDYHLNAARPLRFTLAPPLANAPPLPPTSGNIVYIMAWSLKLRWFTWRTPNPSGPTPTIRIFMLFHDPQRASVLPHSTGLTKGLVGIAHLFAAKDMARANQVIVAHELLHTFGATDKYDLFSTQPRYPDGYAEPDLDPPLPQHRAELMAGRIPINDHQAEQAQSLQQVVIGPLTAREIGWIKAP